MEKESWEEQAQREVREEMSHAGDIHFAMPSPADKIKTKNGYLTVYPGGPLFDMFKPTKFEFYDSDKMDAKLVDEHPMHKTADEQIDELEVALLRERPLVNCPLSHVFTPFLYSRTMFAPADTMITSEVHAEEHQFVISMGVAWVKTREDKWERLEAPHVGITPKGTRRIIYAETGCVWSTFHKTDIYPMDQSKESLAAAVRLVEEQIYEKRENTVLGCRIKNNVLINNKNPLP
jgi:hypothetical protein